MAAQVARERGIPYFGICYGFQWATVEYARNVAGLADADSTECNPDTPTKVIYKLRDLLGVDDLGGTMRLGSYACELTPGSLAAARLRRDARFTSATATATSSTASTSARSTEHGLRISGRSPDGKFVEIAELPGHPWYRRGAVPSRVQVEADAAASAVRRASSARACSTRRQRRARRPRSSR